MLQVKGNKKDPKDAESRSVDNAKKFKDSNAQTNHEEPVHSPTVWSPKIISPRYVFKRKKKVKVISSNYELQPRFSRPSTLADEVLFCVCRKPEDNRTYVGCDLCFDWFHPECLGMSDEDILALLSSKTFFCPSCSKFRGIDTMENTEDEYKTALPFASTDDATEDIQFQQETARLVARSDVPSPSRDFCAELPPSACLSYFS